EQNVDKTWKDCLVGWDDQGIPYTEMSRRLHAMGHVVSPTTIQRLLALPPKLEKEYSPRPETIPPDLYPAVRSHIAKMYEDDDEITLSSLLQSIETEFGLQLSEYPVERIRKEIGYVNLDVRYGHSVRLANRQPRVDWCKARIEENCTFRKHIFTDESMIQLDSNSRKVWVLSTARDRRIKSTFKHPQKVLVWGGISWKGPTNLVVLDGSCRVDAVEYCKILRDGYVEWERENFGGKSLLVQDNAPCHKANITKEFLKREEIEVNYIRHVHTQMRRVIEVDGKPVKD
ncbi:hypothetical protein PMAYCL1PPCAC_15061, partial [Pristionchus mayeri]